MSAVPKAKLRLLLTLDDDGTGELVVEAEDGAFRGASSAWVGQQQLADFGRQLQSVFPLSTDKPVEISGGFWQQERLEQRHVHICVYPIGDAGTLGVRVTLATPLQGGDRLESQSSAAFELKTHYEQLRSFGLAIEALVKGHARAAELGPTDA